MNIECRNAQNRFDKPILSVFVNSNDYHLNSLDTNYNGLSVKYISQEASGAQGFKIVPVALECGNQIYEEGVILSINSKENYIELTRDELQELFDVIMGFNFANEIQVTYQALMLSFMTGKVGTQKQLYNNKFLK